MNETLHDSAYKLARENYKTALHATTASLQKAYPTVGMDTALHVADRGLQLYLAAYRFAEKVWAKELSYELAESSLRKQFAEFSEATCKHAFYEAYVETR